MTQQQEETIIIPVSEFNKNKYDSLMGLTDKDVFTWMHENGYTTRIESITGAILISGKSAYVTIRSRPAANTEKDVLDLLKKKIAWGKEIDRNHLFDYYAIGKMIEEAEQRAESLRSRP